MSAPDLSRQGAAAEASHDAADAATNQEAREIELLRGLVAIPSLSKQEGPAVEYLCAVMERLGFTAAIDGAGSAVGTIGEGPREIVLLGHIDTVPGEIPVRIEDGILHGRGAVDAKGPLATFVCAVARAIQSGLSGVKLTVIGATDEEGDSQGGYYVVDKYRPDLALIGEPSGWDSVVLGYRGSMAATYSLRQAGAHSGAPIATAPQVAVDFWNRVMRHADDFNAGAPRPSIGLSRSCGPSIRALTASTSR